jgi:hypothetical protein
MMIVHRDNQSLDPIEVARVFEASGIARPSKDIPRIAQMFANSNVVISAWDGTRLVGVSRGMTDFSYCCYLPYSSVRARCDGLLPEAWFCVGRQRVTHSAEILTTIHRATDRPQAGEKGAMVIKFIRP